MYFGGGGGALITIQLGFNAVKSPKSLASRFVSDNALKSIKFI